MTLMNDKLQRARLPRVSYEFCIRNSKAAKERLMSALLDFGGAFDARQSMQLGRHADITGLVQLAPQFADRFESHAKTVVLRYVSPTVFDNGSLRAVYASPEDELTNNRLLHEPDFQPPPHPNTVAHSKVMHMLNNSTADDIAKTIVDAGICDSAGNLSSVYQQYDESNALSPDEA